VIKGGVMLMLAPATAEQAAMLEVLTDPGVHVMCRSERFFGNAVRNQVYLHHEADAAHVSNRIVPRHYLLELRDQVGTGAG
jgi:hypothetical protein